MDKKITVIVAGPEDSDHWTYVEHKGQYIRFWATAFDGVLAKEIIGFLKFLEYEVFEVHREISYKPPGTILNFNISE